MERPKLTSELAERIVNLLRDNPGISMTLGDIADETDLPVAGPTHFALAVVTPKRSRHGQPQLLLVKLTNLRSKHSNST